MSRATHPDGKVHGVVAAIQRHDGRWLIVRRSATVAAPLKVCFPGGGIEIGESAEEALVREMREELALEITPLRRVWQWEGDRPGHRLYLQGFLARMESFPPRPDPTEIAEVLWLSLDETQSHPDGLATNADFCAAIRAELAGDQVG